MTSVADQTRTVLYYFYLVNKGAFKLNAPYQDYPPTYLVFRVESMEAGMPACQYINTVHSLHLKTPISPDKSKTKSTPSSWCSKKIASCFCYIKANSY
ncbi:hypothetical protein B0F87_10874 [Methylobacter tundripaludum]|uniref:Uncharacterized protein n=1 Tax=Methylobacter tundripaludum TaxID=173365 RepID=A0A2S6HAZ3_9GAMM|nr:hypothetical protein B0F87_10874 [Methylobacter tundripaludum]